MSTDKLENAIVFTAALFVETPRLIKIINNGTRSNLISPRF